MAQAMADDARLLIQWHVRARHPGPRLAARGSNTRAGHTAAPAAACGRPVPLRGNRGDGGTQTQPGAGRQHCRVPIQSLPHLLFEHPEFATGRLELLPPWGEDLGLSNSCCGCWAAPGSGTESMRPWGTPRSSTWRSTSLLSWQFNVLLVTMHYLCRRSQCQLVEAACRSAESLRRFRGASQRPAFSTGGTERA